MKRFLIGLSLLAMAGSAPVMAQPGHDGNRGRGHEMRGDDGRGHDDRGGQRVMRHRGWGQDRGQDYHWRRGQQMGYNDWRGAERVDYRRYNLRRPPSGYEWRRYNDQYVLGAIATGVIASIIINAGR
jgi:Ni/Co efflux regulator RcnB